MVMENVAVTKVIPRAILAAAVGTGAGYLLDFVAIGGVESPSAQAAHVTECADVLINTPTASKTIPPDCVSVNATEDFYSYSKNNQTYYLLPSKEMVLSQRSSIYSNAEYSVKEAKQIGIAGGIILSQVVFWGLTSINKQRRRQESIIKNNAAIESS